jgi:hypothetical protein
MNRRGLNGRRWVQFGLVVAISLLLMGGLGVCLTQQSLGTDPEPAITPVATFYMPLITHESERLPHAGRVISVPVEHVVALSSWGPDHAAAFAPDGSGVFGDAGDWLSVGIAPNDFGGTYLSRSYLEVRVPAIDGQVVSATLNLVPCTAWDTLHAPLPPATVTLHAGAWPNTLAATRLTDLWGAWRAPVLGQLTTAYDAPCWDSVTETWAWRAIPLPLDALLSGRVLRLVVRDGEDQVDLRAAYMHGSRSVYHPPAAGSAYVELWLEVAE